MLQAIFENTLFLPVVFTQFYFITTALNQRGRFSRDLLQQENDLKFVVTCAGVIKLKQKNDFNIDRIMLKKTLKHDALTATLSLDTLLWTWLCKIFPQFAF